MVAWLCDISGVCGCWHVSTGRSDSSLRDRPGDVHPFEANGSPKGTGLGWHVDYPYHDIKIAWPSVDKPLGCQMLGTHEPEEAAEGLELTPTLASTPLRNGLRESSSR